MGNHMSALEIEVSGKRDANADNIMLRYDVCPDKLGNTVCDGVIHMGDLFLFGRVAYFF